MKLVADIIPVDEIGPRQRQGMFALMEQYYAGMKRDAFEADLNEKRWVILLRDRRLNRIHGFSTQMILDVQLDGRPIHALFSGDTIVERSCWGQSLLAQAWGRLALTLIGNYPVGSLYWFLISKGYKTYRYLPVFFREFYPRFDVTTPPWAAAVIDAVARRKYPSLYDAVSGVIRPQPDGCRLREGIAEVTPERLRDPHIRFFAERNPRHGDGEELCCIAPLTRGNFTLAAARPLRATASAWSAAG
jgi:hypothetical protein